jgi:hypothetical protein
MNDAVSAPNEEHSIADFWKWFGEVAPALLQIGLVGAYGHELSARLAKLNAEQWEIGPLDNRPKEMFFALSTQGDRDQYERNKNIIDQAPPIAGWTFLAAKPPKLWERRFIWQGSAYPPRMLLHVGSRSSGSSSMSKATANALRSCFSFANDSAPI